ncbi:MAG TPA: hypothetical protein VF616_27195, partial [Duganella sp.]|uniref:hypothetical protein n=1 Tax=Duganella sp. TaxID=1904440 RepID=UPI002ED54527
MTIRLLAQYQGNPPNTIVTLAGGVETALVAAGNASTDLSGGVPPVYLTPANTQIGDILYGPDGVPLGLADRTGKLLMNFNGITAPGAPTGLTLTPIAGGLLAAFTPSATLGGTVGTGFEVTLSNGRVQRGAGSPIVINSPAGAVTATVKQINGAGLSVASAASASATVTAYTAPTIPGAPTGLTLTAGNGKVTATWTAAASNGSAIRNTVVTLSNGATATAIGSATTVDVITPNGSPVTATARANNGEGAGPISAVSNSVTPTSVEVPPSAPVITAVTGFNNRVMVNMVAPATGVAAQYKLTASTGETVTVAANGLPYQAATLTGLTNGSAVTIQAQAISAGGAMSALSSASASVTPVASRQISATGNTFIPDAKHASNKQSMNVTFYTAARDLSTLGVEFPGWYVGGRVETNNTGTETWEADVTWNGNVTRITFGGGNNSGTVAPGANLKSDEVTLGFTIPAGAEFSIGNYCTTTGEITFFSWYAADGKARQQYGVSGVPNLVGVLDKSALPLATSTPSAGAFVRTPSAIFSTGDGPAVALSINSNSVGRGDTGDNTHSQGHLGRALRLANIPYMHVGVSGDQLSGSGNGWLFSNAKRIALAKRYSTHALAEPAINDLSAGRTAAQVVADRLTFKNLWGATYPIAFTTLPSITTGDWTTIVGQTPNAISGEIQAFNTSTLAGVAGAIAIFDVNLMI